MIQLFSLLTSAVWQKDDETRLVWITLIAMSNRNGAICASALGLIFIIFFPDSGGCGYFRCPINCIVRAVWTIKNKITAIAINTTKINSFITGYFFNAMIAWFVGDSGSILLRQSSNA